MNTEKLIEKMTYREIEKYLIYFIYLKYMVLILNTLQVIILLQIIHSFGINILIVSLFIISLTFYLMPMMIDLMLEKRKELK